MTEQDPKNREPQPGDVAGELRDLGKNLAEILRSAWESEERKRLQEEIRKGISDLGSTLNEAANEFQQSQTGQRLKDDVEDFRQRVRTGEVETRIRSEILSALRTVNSELEKAARKQPPEGESGDRV